MINHDGEQQDPDFDWIRSHWKGLTASPSLTARVMSEYREATGATRKPRIRFAWIPLSASCALVALVLLWWRPTKPEPRSYRAVEQPRLIVVSQGEHP